MNKPARSLLPGDRVADLANQPLAEVEKNAPLGSDRLLSYSTPAGRAGNVLVPEWLEFEVVGSSRES
jgi:hypothetical protein